MLLFFDSASCMYTLAIVLQTRTLTVTLYTVVNGCHEHVANYKFFLLIEIGFPSMFEADSDELQEVAIDLKKQIEDQNSEPN